MNKRVKRQKVFTAIDVEKSRRPNDLLLDVPQDYVAESVLSSPDAVEIAGKALPVSRKYKDSVRVVLSIPKDGDGRDVGENPENQRYSLNSHEEYVILQNFVKETITQQE